MISVTQAKEIIAENKFLLAPKKVSLQEAAGLVLAEDVFAITELETQFCQ